jgi:sugar/nucleoside kinase (ribokinase family)
MNKSTYNVVIIGQITYDDIVTYHQPVIKDSPGGDGLYSLSGAFMINSESLGLVVRKGNDCNLDEIKALTGDHVNYDGVVTITDQPNIHIWNMFDREGHRYFINQRWSGSDDYMAPVPADIPDAYMNKSKAIHVAAIPFPWGKEVIEHMEKAAESVIVQVDPHFNHVYRDNFEIWMKMLKHINIFLPSEEEFIRLFGIKTQEDIRQYVPFMKQITNTGPEICGIKLGSKGAMIYDRIADKCYHAPTYDDVKLVDVTGCGDVFCGAFLSKYTETKDTFEALLAGNIASSFNLEHYGVLENFLVTREMFEERMRQYRTLVKKDCLLID